MGQGRLRPSYFFISLVLGPLNSLLEESTYPNRYTAKAKFCFCKNNKRMIISVLIVVGRCLLVRPARADETLVLAVVCEAGVAEAGQRRDRCLRRARIGVTEFEGRLPLAGLEGVRRARTARWRDEVELRLRIPSDALAADPALGRIRGAELR